MTEQPAIRLTGLTKEFGTVTAVDHVDLEIAAGEFFSMLGPSGSGKTTVLRLIAGFEQPTSGTIELFGEDVTARAPFDRDVNTVFQDYALFPHMNVLDNVAYGLRVRGMKRAGASRPRDEGARRRAPRAVRRPQARAALRRPAPARRPRPRDRRAAEGAAPRRAAGRARPQAPRADAGRAQADPARARHHLHLRDARPGGGADPLRPHRRVQRGRHRAARHPVRALRAPGIAFRRRLRRHLQPVRPRALAAAPRPAGRALGPAREAHALARAPLGGGRALGAGHGRRVHLRRQRHPQRHRSRCRRTGDRARAQRHGRGPADDERGERVLVSWHDSDVVSLIPPGT